MHHESEHALGLALDEEQHFLPGHEGRGQHRLACAQRGELLLELPLPAPGNAEKGC